MRGSGWRWDIPLCGEACAHCALQVQQALRKDVHTGDLFVFRGRSGSSCKILFQPYPLLVRPSLPGRAGAPLKNLAHSASFYSWLNDAPSNAGTKHLKGRSMLRPVLRLTGRRRNEPVDRPCHWLASKPFDGSKRQNLHHLPSTLRRITSTMPRAAAQADETCCPARGRPNRRAGTSSPKCPIRPRRNNLSPLPPGPVAMQEGARATWLPILPQAVPAPWPAKCRVPGRQFP